MVNQGDCYLVEHNRLVECQQGKVFHSISHPRPIRQLRCEVAIYMVRDMGLTGCYRLFVFILTGHSRYLLLRCGLLTTVINVVITEVMSQPNVPRRHRNFQSEASSCVLPK